MPQGLPVSRLINVQVVLTPLAAQSPNLNTALIMGSSDVIDPVERIRSYGSLDEVAADFGVNTPEYLAADLFFSQKPQPVQLYIGRWVETNSAGLLEGGAVSVANQANAVWNAINPGAFFYRNNGVPRAITGLNFAATANMNAVAAVIQAALNAQDAGSTCHWDAERSRFVVESGTTGALSSISYLAAPTAVGFIQFNGQPAANDTITLNGTVVTFVAGAPAAFQVQIGVDVATTMANTLAFLQASADAQLVKFQYMTSGIKLYLNAAASGAGGNALTVAKAGANLAVSGATLAGATGTDISHIAAGLAADGGTLVQGQAAEQPVDAVVAANSNRQYWYMLTFASTDLTNNQVLAVANFIEGTANKHIYGQTTTDPNAANPASVTDMPYVLKQGGYTRSFAQYSENPYAVASFLGRAVTVNFAGQNTVLTMMYKVEPAVAPEALTTAQADALEAKNCNVFVQYNNNTAILQYGTVASGNFFDEIQDLDAFANDVQTSAFNALYTSPTKIPQTDAGNHQLSNVIEGACARAVSNGTLGPGQWNTNGFGQLVEGQWLAKGYYIFTPPIYTQSQADREARKSVPIQIAAKLAGAIHTVDVIINVNR